MHRFFSAQSNFNQDYIEISDLKEVRHLRTVLRMKQGSKIRVFNSRGEEIEGTVNDVSPRQILVRKDYQLPPQRQRPIEIVLACAIPKKAKFEFIIEKCTELGIDEIIPLRTERTEGIFSSNQQSSKEKRYGIVAVNATKQSGRVTVPKILPMTNFPEALRSFEKDTLCLIASLVSPRQSLFEVFDQKNIATFKRIAFFIGPEGDFSSGEFVLAHSSGCLAVSLGSNVLKVDTAAISCVSFANLWIDHHLSPSEGRLFNP